jgi:hypothetical protein
MYRHDLDPIALVFGALFTVLGLAYAIGHWTWFDFRGGWILAALLIALGLAGIFSASRRAARRTPASTDTAASDTADNPSPSVGPMVDIP